MLLSALPPQGDPHNLERLRDVEAIVEGQMEASKKKEKEATFDPCMGGQAEEDYCGGFEALE